MDKGFECGDEGGKGDNGCFRGCDDCGRGGDGCDEVDKRREAME